MARDISTISQTNLWGKQASEGTGLDPQRNDLYFVDFTTAQKNVMAATGLQLAPIIPQYVRSATLPELRTKAEPVRRDSIPFQMPSWDDPLDPVKIVFLYDTKGQNDSSDVARFLDAWLALTRAGRGSRAMGYSPLGNWFKLNSDYRVDFQFNIQLYLLRGQNITVGGFAVDGEPSNAEWARITALANATYRNDRKRMGLIQQGNPVALPEDDISFETAVGYSGFDPGAAYEQDMVIHTIYVLKNAWLGAYKISDLSYTDSTLVTVEATFYVDSVDMPDVPTFYGEARKIEEPS